MAEEGVKEVPKRWFSTHLWMKDALQWGRREPLRKNKTGPAAALAQPAWNAAYGGGASLMSWCTWIYWGKGERQGQGEVQEGRHLRRGKWDFLWGARRTSLISFLSLQTQGLLLGWHLRLCGPFYFLATLSLHVGDGNGSMPGPLSLLQLIVYTHRIPYLIGMCYFICKIHSWPLNMMVWTAWVYLLTVFFSQYIL